MADGDLDTFVAQPFHIGTVGDVRAGDGVAEIGQHLGDTAHADAPDADEMHRSDVARQFHETGFPLLSSPAQAGDPVIRAPV